MKKTIFAFTVLFLSGFMSIAQGPPNAGFEDWSGSPEAPDEWGVLNISIPLIGDFVSATKSTDSFSGTYALALESLSIPLVGFVIPGAAVTGTLNPFTFTATGGFACTQKPTVLKGYYKYAPVGIDTASIAVIFTRWNPDSLRRDTVGLGMKLFRNAVSSYTLFSIPLIFDPLETPDTAMITMFSSSIISPADGSIFFVDDISFYPAPIIAGTGAEASMHKLIAYPVPSSSKIFIDLGNFPSAETIFVYDILGNKMVTIQAGNGSCEIDVKGLADGLYLCRIFDAQQNLLATKKLTVSK